MSRAQTIANHYEKEDKRRVAKLKSRENLNIERREPAPEDTDQTRFNNMRYFNSDNQQSNGNQQQSSTEESE